MTNNSVVRSAAKHLRELPFLVVDPRRYASMRSTRGRQWFWNLFARMESSELKKRQRLAGELGARADLPRIPEDQGFAKLDWMDSGVVDAAVQEARSVLRSTDLAELESRLGHPHLVHVPLDRVLGPGGAIWNFATHPDLLRVIADYMGFLPLVQGIYLLYSPNRTNVGDTSQFLHLDAQDVRTVKVFLYVEDVTEDTGPLTIIPAADSARLAETMRYRKAPGQRRVSDEDATRVLGESWPLQMVGEAGTVYAVDTDRCFHFGSRKAGKPRYLLSFNYFSPFSFALPMNWRSGLPFASIGKKHDVSEMERVLFGAE